MGKIKQIEIKYVLRENGCPMDTVSFYGTNADILAANYQSAHPELREVSFNVIHGK